MIREWLLVVWIGTSTNFSVQSVHWSQGECHGARDELSKKLTADFIVVCTQDMREGRSQLPKRGSNIGVAK